MSICKLAYISQLHRVRVASVSRLYGHAILGLKKYNDRPLRAIRMGEREPKERKQGYNTVSGDTVIIIT